LISLFFSYFWRVLKDVAAQRRFAKGKVKIDVTSCRFFASVPIKKLLIVRYCTINILAIDAPLISTYPLLAKPVNIVVWQLS
jgi:hypothetical protein